MGLETLKNLCLAGIGSFIILDSHKLAAEDVGANFLPVDCIGKNRGEAAKTMCLNLNDDISGQVNSLEEHLPPIDHADVREIESTNDSFKEDLDFWKQFHCIIASGNLNIKQIEKLSDICWNNNTPLILCRSIGFYGLMRAQFKHHIVLETHPDWRPANYDPSKPENLVIKTEKIGDDYQTKEHIANGEEDEDEFFTICLCLRALDLFFSQFNRLPGRRSAHIEPDLKRLKDCLKEITGKSNLNQLKTLEQCLYELSRYGGAELHTTSAFMGGCVAQEVIKLLTNQYIPVDDTLVYNAMSSTTRSFRFNEIFAKT